MMTATRRSAFAPSPSSPSSANASAKPRSPRSILERGFDFEGTRVPLIGPQGIFKPAVVPEVPLTITTAPPVEHRERPYDDGFTDGGFLRYRYRGTDPNHRDNVGLRTAMQRQTPLIYLHGHRPGSL